MVSKLRKAEERADKEGRISPDLEMLQDLRLAQTNIIHFFKTALMKKYGIDLTENERESVIRNLTNTFPKEEEKKKFGSCVFIESDNAGDYQISKHFKDMLQNKVFADMVYELVDFGMERYQKYYASRYKDTNFQLYQKYTYEDVCRLLNWKKNMNAQNIGGYFYDVNTKTRRYLSIMKRQTMQLHMRTGLFQKVS